MSNRHANGKITAGNILPSDAGCQFRGNAGMCVLVIKRLQCETGILRYQSDKRRAIVMLNAIVFRAVYIRALDAGCWLIV